MVKNRRLLIVDDEAEIRKGYRDFLTPQKTTTFQSSRSQLSKTVSSEVEFELYEAENGEKALEMVLAEFKQGRRFAGAVVDVRMPGKLDGLQFIREAWKTDPSLLVAVATAYQDRSVDEIDRMFGVQFQDQWDYLNKPFSAGEILQKARQLISSWNRREREHDYLTQIEAQRSTLVAQERLAAVGRLARSVGHEFGNVLQPLVAKLEIAQRRIKKGEPEGVLELFDDMMEAVTLGANICQDLLTFSRESKGPGELAVRSTIQLREPIEKAQRLLRHELKRRDAQLVISVDPGLEIEGYESKLVQLFVNLLTNSLAAVQDGGLLNVRASRKGQKTHVVVSDNGSGISAENLARVFEPLFSTKGDQGNGLGLSVCRQIVEDHAGTIRIESKVGSGTEVFIDFSSD